MSLFPRFKNTMLSKIIQGQSRNRATLNFLKALEYPMPEIRGALLKLNGIQVTDLVDGHNISVTTLYAVIAGIRRNQLSRMIVADALGFHVPELFPEEQSSRQKDGGQAKLKGESSRLKALPFTFQL